MLTHPVRGRMAAVEQPSVPQPRNHYIFMKKTILLTMGAILGLLLLAIFPAIHVTLVVINFAVHIVVLGMQLLLTRLPKISVRPEQVRNAEPFVSVFVPAYNEPPAILGATLQSLRHLSWQNYEVLVIDNNTLDEATWRPIEQLCRDLGPRFRFLHVEGLKGAKAGAMNWAIQFINPNSEFIFVVDADYVVERRALKRALSYCSDGVGLVQFPQEYRNIGPANVGMALDFKHFFAGYMNMANRLGCVPSTGTLSLIRVSALRAVNGFDAMVVTEDADLGFRLNSAGYRSVYAPEVIGRGLMPHDLEGLKKQRWRWAFGNAQILKLNWRSLLLSRDLSVRQKIGYLVQLTAWFNFNLIPSLTLIVLAPLALMDRLHTLHPYLVVLSGFTLTTFMVLRFGTVFYSLRREHHSLGEVSLAFFTHLGLGWIFSSSWIKCLFNHHSPFVRTNKFINARVPGLIRTTIVEAGLGIALLAACVLLTISGFVIGPIAALAMAMSRFLVYWVWWQTRKTWHITSALDTEAIRATQTDHPSHVAFS